MLLLIIITTAISITITVIIMAVIISSFHKLRGRGGTFWLQEGSSTRVALKLQTEHSR